MYSPICFWHHIHGRLGKAWRGFAVGRKDRLCTILYIFLGSGYTLVVRTNAWDKYDLFDVLTRTSPLQLLQYLGRSLLAYDC